MRIDRSSFLALTATIAAGCAQRTPPPESTPAPVVHPSAVIVVESAPPAEPVFPDEAASGVSSPSPPQVMAPEDPDYPPPTQEGTGSGPWSRRPAQGPALACAKLSAPPGPHCESFSSLQQECEDIVGTLEPGVAQRTADCLTRNSGTRRICDFLAVTKCAEGALANVPIDRGAAAPCRAIVQKCGRHGTTLTQHKCEAFLSATSRPIQPASITCLSESCALTPCFFALP